MRNLLIIIFMSILAISCGDTKHKIDASEVPDKIEIIHRIDIEDFKDNFTSACEEEFDNQVEIDICVQEKVDDLLKLFSGIVEEDSNE